MVRIGLWCKEKNDMSFKTNTTVIQVISDAAITNSTEIIKTDGSSIFTASLDMNSNKIINVSAPTLDDDAATKLYVDNIASGLDVKKSVKAATTTNITLSGTQTIDTVVLSASDRVLVKDQTDSKENGIYDVAIGAWVRSSDADNTPSNEVSGGMFTFVEAGSQSGTGWVLSNITGDAILGTDNLIFTQFSTSSDILAGTNLTKIGNTINLDSVLTNFASTGIDDNATSNQLTITDSSSVFGGIITMPNNTNFNMKNFAGTNAEMMRLNTSDQLLIGSGTTSVITKTGGITRLVINSLGAAFVDKIIVNNTIDSTSTTTGSIQTDGGLGVVKNLRVGGIIISNNSIFIEAGAVNAPALYLRADAGNSNKIRIRYTGNQNFAIRDDTAGIDRLIIGTDGTISTPGIFSVDNTTDSTSTTTGSIHTDGGLGVAKNAFFSNNRVSITGGSQASAYTPAAVSTLGIQIKTGTAAGAGNFAHTGLTLFGDDDNFAGVHVVHNNNADAQLVLVSNNLEAARFDSSQNATFAGDVIGGSGSALDFSASSSKQFRFGKTSGTAASGVGLWFDTSGFGYIVRNGAVQLLLGNTNTGGGSQESIRFVRSGTDVGSIDTTGTTTSYNTSSDPRLKSEFTAIKSQEAINIIKETVDNKWLGEFTWLSNGEKTWGYNAHELIDNQPNFGGSEGFGSRDKKIGDIEIPATYKTVIENDKEKQIKLTEDQHVSPAGVDQSKRVPVLEMAIYELIKRIETLEGQVKSLQGGDITTSQIDVADIKDKKPVLKKRTSPRKTVTKRKTTKKPLVKKTKPIIEKVVNRKVVKKDSVKKSVDKKEDKKISTVTNTVKKQAVKKDVKKTTAKPKSKTLVIKANGKKKPKEK